MREKVFIKEKILITVKTYPILSKKYAELVCTAGVNEAGEWRRIYPVPFRQLNSEQKYKKYQWIEVDLKKAPRDRRPESYIVAGQLKLLNDVLPTNDRWHLRREAFINKVEIYNDLNKLIGSAHENRLSLALFRPNRWLDFVVEREEREWDPEKLAILQAQKKQGNLFKDTEAVAKEFEIVNKLPYKFSYRFERSPGKESKLMIEDWEIGALYWNCLRSSNGNEKIAVEKVRQKYWDNFVQDKGKDILLVLGTTLEHHNKKALNPFVIVGVIPLPLNMQQNLF